MYQRTVDGTIPAEWFRDAGLALIRAADVEPTIRKRTYTSQVPALRPRLASFWLSISINRNSACWRPRQGFGCGKVNASGPRPGNETSRELRARRIRMKWRDQAGETFACHIGAVWHNGWAWRPAYLIEGRAVHSPGLAARRGECPPPPYFAFNRPAAAWAKFERSDRRHHRYGSNGGSVAAGHCSGLVTATLDAPGA